jgi:transcriptional regulator with XRE-family HTH domain
MNNIFIENLKKFRVEKGLTQEQVADECEDQVCR